MADNIMENYINITDILLGLNELAADADKGSEDSKTVYIQLIDCLFGFVSQSDDLRTINRFGIISSKLKENIENNMFLTPELDEYIDMAAKFIANKLIRDLLQNPHLDKNDFEKIILFFTNSNLNNDTKALGILSAALTQSISQPDVCYSFAIEAFKLDPSVGKYFNTKYIYDEKQICDEYYESCPICGDENAVSHYCAPQFIFPEDEIKFSSPVKLWRKCNGCGNIYSYNFPTLKVDTINGNFTRTSDYETITPRFPLSITSDILNKCREFTAGKRYLEIGIGSGEMLAGAIEMGYDVTAVEICREDCEKISAVLGVDIKCCDFIEYNTDEKYDIIIMGDVLEHMLKPVEGLKKAKKLLADNGVLWLSTPNYNSSFSRLQKFKDPMWNQYHHLTYFSYETLLPILNDIGLDVVRYDISNRYNGSMELFCMKMNSK